MFKLFYATLDEYFTSEDIKLEPFIELDDSFRQRLLVRAGQLLLSAQFDGRPEPDAKWSNVDECVALKANVTINGDSTTLIIPSCDRTDSGKYTLTIIWNEKK